MRNLERQAKSLSGAKGAPLEQDVITAVGQGGQGGAASGRSTRPNTRPGTLDPQAGSRSHSTQRQQLARPKGTKAEEPKLSSADKIARADCRAKGDEGGLGERELVGRAAQGS